MFLLVKADLQGRLCRAEIVQQFCQSELQTLWLHGTHPVFHGQKHAYIYPTAEQILPTTRNLSVMRLVNAS